MARRIVIASDHAAVGLKAVLFAMLREQGFAVDDLGPFDAASVDYPDYGYKIARAIAEDRADFAVAICGSGIGISIAVNREPACRCALVSEPLSAQFARTHNDANVIAMGARMIGEEMAKACLTTFLSTRFEGGRHQHRIEKLSTPTLQPIEA